MDEWRHLPLRHCATAADPASKRRAPSPPILNWQSPSRHAKDKWTAFEDLEGGRRVTHSAKTGVKGGPGGNAEDRNPHGTRRVTTHPARRARVIYRELVGVIQKPSSATKAPATPAQSLDPFVHLRAHLSQSLPSPITRDDYPDPKPDASLDPAHPPWRR